MIAVRLLLSGTVTLWPCGEAPRLTLTPALGRAVNVGGLRKSRAVLLRVSPQSRLAVRVILTLAPSTCCHVAHERLVAGIAPKAGAHAGTGQELHNKRPRLRVIGLGSSAARARMTFGCPLLRAKCKHSTGSQPPQPPATGHAFCISKSTRCLQARAKSHTLYAIHFLQPSRTSPHRRRSDIRCE